jgi:hypothetical protein
MGPEDCLSRKSHSSMGDVSMDRRHLDAFQREAWNMVGILRAGLKGRREFFAQLGIVYQILAESPKYSAKISVLDVENFFTEILHYTRRKSFQEITLQDLRTALRRHILREDQDFDFYYPIGKADGFLEGQTLGAGELQSFDGLPARVRIYVKKARGLGRYPHNASNTFSGRKLEDNWFLHVRIRTIGWTNAALNAERLAQRSLAAFEVLTGHSEFMRTFVRNPLGREVFVSCGEDEASGYYPPAESSFGVSNMPGFESQLKDLTLMIRRENMSELERRIVSVIDILAMIDERTPLNIKFLLKMFALEGLLLSEDDRDYLGWRLSEKITFLLGDNKVWVAFAFGILPHMGFVGNGIAELVEDEFAEIHTLESRLILNREVVRLYRKRFAFAHPRPRPGKDAIAENDYEMISWLLRLSVSSILALTKMESRILRSVIKSINPVWMASWRK